MSNFLFHPQAQKELWEAIDWYISVNQKVARNFEVQINQQLKRIQDTPQHFPLVFKMIRRAKVNKFPYSILFETLDENTYILAVFHESRNPSIWKSRQESK